VDMNWLENRKRRVFGSASVVRHAGSDGPSSATSVQNPELAFCGGGPGDQAMTNATLTGARTVSAVNPVYIHANGSLTTVS
jgi:hypothetical protein